MKRNAFTLIELLAVIVILAVIAIIVTPVITGIIDTAKKGASARSAEGYIDAVKLSNSSTILSSNKMPNGRYFINSDGNLIKDGVAYKVEFSGAKPTSGEVTIQDGKIIDGVISTGGYVIDYSSSERKVTKIDADKVYGLEYNNTSKTYTRLEDAVGLNACVGTNTEACNNDFDSAEIYRDMVEVTDDYGNSFIKIPKFYIKKEVSDEYLRWYVSRTKQDSNYYLPYCFYDFTNNKELDYVLVGKYDANIDSTGLKLESKTNKIPYTTQSIVEYRGYADANNSETKKGYQQMDIHVMDALQMLFIIEFGTLDSQSVMAGFTYGVTPWQNSYLPVEAMSNSNIVKINPSQAIDFIVGQRLDISTEQQARDVASDRLITAIDKENGIITFDGSPVNITTSMILSNSAYSNGTTDNILTSSGSAIDNQTGKYCMNYRGIENLFGNIWQFIDGVIIDNQSDGFGAIYTDKNASTYSTENLGSNYEKIGYQKVGLNGYINKMSYDSNYPFIQYPANDFTNQFGYSVYKDYYYQDNKLQQKRIIQGGDWADTNNGGLFRTNADLGLTTTRISLGTRLIKKVM